MPTLFRRLLGLRRCLDRPAFHPSSRFLGRPWAQGVVPLACKGGRSGFGKFARGVCKIYAPLMGVVPCTPVDVLVQVSGMSALVKVIVVVVVVLVVCWNLGFDFADVGA